MPSYEEHSDIFSDVLPKLAKNRVEAHDMQDKNLKLSVSEKCTFLD